MKILDMKYPEGHMLSEWDRTVLWNRMRQSIEGGMFSVCNLDLCRQTVLGDNRATELKAELDALHCVKYQDLSPDILAALLAKVENYVGVRLTMKRQRRGMAVVVTVVSFAALLALAAYVLNAAIPASRPLPAFQEPLVSKEGPTLPVFTLSTITKQPGSVLAKSAALQSSDDVDYMVSVEITPARQPMPTRRQAQQP